MSDITLVSFIERLLEVADKRNLAKENPVTFTIDHDNDQFYVVVSILEPNHVTLPMNVTWIVADAESPHFKKALRRASALPFNEFRNTWAELRTYENFLEEKQFWDLSSTFQVGEIQVPGIKQASTTYRGTFKLNAIAEDPADPVVVGDNDVRMSNPRIPLAHTHPLLPATMLAGSTGINEFFVRISDTTGPTAGDVLFINQPGEIDGEWIGEWRKVVDADVGYDGPIFESIVIHGPADDLLNEGTSIPFTATAVFSDGTEIHNIAAQWEVIAGNEAGTISTSTGMFTSVDIPEDILVRVRATWTHQDSRKQLSANYEMTVVDTTIVSILTHIEITGNVEVLEGGNTIYYTVTAFYDDGSSKGVIPSSFTSSNPAAGILDGSAGIFTSATEVTGHQTTSLVATYLEKGVTKSATLELRVVDTTIYPESVVINGPASVNENSEATYGLVVTFSDGTSNVAVVSDWAVSPAEAGVIDPVTGIFTATENLFSDVNAKITASYTNAGRTVSAEKDIVVVDQTVYPVAATITASVGSQIEENTTQMFQFVVDFTDGTSSPVVITNWMTSNSSAGTINANTGEFIAATDIPNNETTTISGSFTQAGQTVSATFELTVLDVTNYPSSIQIVGNANMSEGSSQALKATVTYQDGTTLDVVANWAITTNGFATISGTGVITAAANVDTNGSETVTVNYSESGVALSDTKVINILDETIYPVSATIVGPISIDEGTSATYTLEVSFDDGSRSIVPVSTFALDNAAAGTLSSTGAFNAKDGLTSNVSAVISASHTVDGVTVNATRNITVKDVTIYPSSARILGALSLNEESSETYQFEVTWTDATKTIESVTNWTSSDTSVATINASTGKLSSLSIDADGATDISASFTAEGITVSNTITVTVLDQTNYPISAIIKGPVSVNEGDVANYKFEVTFTDGTVQEMPVTDWVSSDTDVGVISAEGAFQASSSLTSDSTTRITASYTAHNTTVNSFIDVTVIDSTAYPVSAEIVGPNTVDELTAETYQIRVTFTDTTVQIVSGATWETTNPAAGTIDIATGVFTALENNTRTNVTTKVRATYTAEGVSVVGEKTIGIVDTTAYPQSAIITGANTIDEGSTETYVFIVTYTDGSSAEVAVTDWAVDSGTSATIDASGVLTASADFIGESDVVISASYTELGETVSTTKTIRAKDTILRPVSLTLSGPSEINEGGNSLYEATVEYDDGTTELVFASDWASSDSSIASISMTGLLEAPDGITEDQTVTITASYTAHGVTVNGSLNVVIKNIAPLDAGMPFWGYGPFAGPDLSEGGQPDAQTFLITLTAKESMPTTSGETFTYQLPDASTFAYFAHPKSMGIAVFTDKGNGFPGAWDGAKWLADLSNFADDKGPIEVTYDDGTGPSLWYVYRTDWEGPNAAPQTFQVDYPV